MNELPYSTGSVGGSPFGPSPGDQMTWDFSQQLGAALSSLQGGVEHFLGRLSHDAARHVHHEAHWLATHNTLPPVATGGGAGTHQVVALHAAAGHHLWWAFVGHVVNPVALGIVGAVANVPAVIAGILETADG